MFNYFKINWATYVVQVFDKKPYWFTKCTLSQQGRQVRRWFRSAVHFFCCFIAYHLPNGRNSQNLSNNYHAFLFFLGDWNWFVDLKIMNPSDQPIIKRPHSFRTISNKNEPCDLLRKKVNLGRMHGGVWTKGPSLYYTVVWNALKF